jgi:glycosyl transferase, family 25
MADLPVFIINLDRSPERLSFIHEQAGQLGLQVERFPAIDGKMSLPAWLAPQFASADRLTSGEIGCYASHLSLYRKLLDDKIEAAVVLEDDAQLPDDFAKIVAEAVKAAPKGWDIIHLCSNFGVRQIYHRLAPLPGTKRHLVRHHRLPIRMTGYVISTRGCKRMLAISPRVRPIDLELHRAYLHGLDLYGVAPTPVSNNARFISTIATDERPTANKKPGTLVKLYASAWKTYKLGVVGTVVCTYKKYRFSVQRRFGRIGSASP